MTCRELTDFLDEYLAGALASEVRGQFEAHLTECRDCLVYLRGYRETVDVLHETGRDLTAEVPADVPPGLLDAIAAARRRDPRR
jgi:predicted anti-sigma-YlaC factor YlaD